MQLEKISPAKIPIPPKEEMQFLWILRSQGMSNNFFASEIFIITGIDVYAMKNEIRDMNKIESIGCLFGGVFL